MAIKIVEVKCKNLFVQQPTAEYESFVESLRTSF